ncbi:MAG: hypothetical protein LBD22_01290 [Spirochaetaceae bacterium]|jgi:hypothetical protein|nr:hypothetical protein [Spirochaetaceae bacterium]
MFQSLVLIILLVAFTGCELRINGAVNQAGRAELSVSGALGTKITALLRRVTAQSGAAATRPLLDAAELTTQLRAIAGIEHAEFKQKGSGGIEGQLVISKISSFIPQYIPYTLVWEEAAHSGKMMLRIDRTNGPAILALFSPDLGDYLSALMAPIATGEELTKNSYLELLNSVYNAEIAAEIAAARLKLTLTVPGEISTIRGGAYTGRQAVFDTALLDFFVLEKPLLYEIQWRQ